MSYRYWDWQSTGTGTSTTTSPSYINNSSSISNTFTSGTFTNTPNPLIYYYYTQTVVVHEEILIEEPEHWTEADAAAFTRLVNEETQTGWKIKLRIKGHIDIADASISVRSMRDFIPLLKQRASREDREKIHDFFDAHPAEKVPPE